MDYNHITQFLDRFKKLLSQGQAANSIIAETITKHIAIEIDLSNITTKGTVIQIKGSPMLRNEILMHKQGILKDLSDMLPERHFSDLR